MWEDRISRCADSIGVLGKSQRALMKERVAVDLTNTFVGLDHHPSSFALRRTL
jgi:hypothetical protein